MASITSLLVTCSALALREVDKQIIFDKLEDYELCQLRDYSGQFCQEALTRWISLNKADAFKAGKMTRRVMTGWVAIPLFHQAFEAKNGDCKDQDVKLAVLSALDLPKGSQDEVVDQAKKIGIITCFNEMKDEFTKAGVGSSLFGNVCHVLSQKGLLSDLKKKKCSEVKL